MSIYDDLKNSQEDLKAKMANDKSTDDEERTYFHQEVIEVAKYFFQCRREAQSHDDHSFMFMDTPAQHKLKEHDYALKINNSRIDLQVHEDRRVIQISNFDKTSNAEARLSSKPGEQATWTFVYPGLGSPMQFVSAEAFAKFLILETSEYKLFSH